MADPVFGINQRVRRIEDREIVGATVLGFEPDMNSWNYEIAYDEGGTGWWPENCLEAEPPAQG